MMFTELPFLDRFAAARDCGFDAVEYLFPYDHPADEIAKRRENGQLFARIKVTAQEIINLSNELANPSNADVPY